MFLDDALIAAIGAATNPPPLSIGQPPPGAPTRTSAQPADCFDPTHHRDRVPVALLFEGEAAMPAALIAACRDRWAGHCVLCHPASVSRQAALCALGFHRLALPALQTIEWQAMHFSLQHYKPAPDWLNADQWANPDRWNAERW